MEFYPPIKTAHVALALLSGGVFALRGLAVLAGVGTARAKWVRRASMLVDSALLAAALLLLAARHLNPFVVPWLQVKLALLLAYILLGVLALRGARSRAGKGLAFVLALLSFGMMLSVARTHDPMGFLAFLRAWV